MAKEKIVVFGYGDIAQIANYYFDIDSNYEVVAFTLDRAYIKEDTYEGKPLVAFEDIEALYPSAEYKMFIALSYAKMNKLRASKYTEAKQKGYTLVSYVSSHCTYLSQFPCGDNCFIFENNTIQPFVEIGNNVTLWSGNHIGHHSVIKDHNFVSSHVVISGHCTIERYCFLGVNSSLAHNVTIAEETLLGAGTVMSKNSEAGRIYVPARSVMLDKKSNEVTL
jgi:sugar O-acyltransferase (sialic acid O-acetyltransferase NeuD family)